MPILIGLTNKQTMEWTDPRVGGLILLGLVFRRSSCGSSRAPPSRSCRSSLFRNRIDQPCRWSPSSWPASASSAPIIFVPRWFQVVLGSSATESGYQILPLLAGLIVSSVVSGQVISRTGRYSWLIVGSLALPRPSACS